jgi:hydrogenase-4 component B
MMTPEYTIIVAMVVCFGAAGLLYPLGRYRQVAGWIAFLAVAASSVLVLSAVISVLWHGPGQATTLLPVTPLGYALRIYVDGLSALFLGLIAVVALPASLYSIEYMRHQEGKIGRYYRSLLCFIAAMYGLVTTTDMMYFFFIFWQIMTFAGWALIRYDSSRPENLHAAFKYLCLMQVACFVTLVGAFLLASPEVKTAVEDTLPRYDFDAVAARLPELLQQHGLLTGLAFGLFLVGFGIKLGMWPFGQIWLPDAHPAAPSPISALLSGVMIKTGVYGLMRYFIWLVPAAAKADYPAATWGAVMAVLGAITLLTGTLSALRQNHSKRLLAFSSIGQAGYILFALGASLALLSAPSPAGLVLGAAAFYGAMFHTLNHGVFKSLLFLNAGSVLHATGTQDLNKLGGLIRFMPATAVTALVASFAISGVPLSSGFASKWTMYLAAIQGGASRWYLPLIALLAIFTSGVTLALLIKFYGAIFLSRTSALVAQRAAGQARLEPGWLMSLPQIVLGLICLAAGLFPGLWINLIARSLQASRQGLGEVLADAHPFTQGAIQGLSGLQQPAVYAPLAVVLVIGLLFILIRALAHAGGALRRTSAPWLCGYAHAHETNRYRASGFYGEIHRLLRQTRRPVRPPRLNDGTAPGN